MDIERPALRKGGEIDLAGADLCALVSEILGRGKPVRFKTRGSSMSPIVRDGDIVVVSPFGERGLRTGDVVAFVHPAAARLAVHRLIGRTERGFLVRGDNALMPDGEVGAGSVLGLVTSIERRGRKIGLGRRAEGRFLAVLSRAGFLRYILAGLRRSLGRMGRRKEGGRENG